MAWVHCFFGEIMYLQQLHMRPIRVLLAERLPAEGVTAIYRSPEPITKDPTPSF